MTPFFALAAHTNRAQIRCSQAPVKSFFHVQFQQNFNFDSSSLLHEFLSFLCVIIVVAFPTHNLTQGNKKSATVMMMNYLYQRNPARCAKKRRDILQFIAPLDVARENYDAEVTFHAQFMFTLSHCD